MPVRDTDAGELKLRVVGGLKLRRLLPFRRQRRGVPQARAGFFGQSAPAARVTPVTDMPPLSRQMIALKNRVRTVLKGYYRKASTAKRTILGKRCTDARVWRAEPHP